MDAPRMSQAVGLSVVAGLFLLANSARGQIWSRIVAEKNLSPQAVAWDQVPRFGTFWSLQRTNYAPLPFNPYPELQIYYLGYGNAYLIDDS